LSSILASSNDLELSGVGERFLRIDAGGFERGDLFNSNLQGDFGVSGRDFGVSHRDFGDFGVSTNDLGERGVFGVSGLGGGDIMPSLLSGGFFKFNTGGRGDTDLFFGFSLV
jgi:hypothetical protein